MQHNKGRRAKVIGPIEVTVWNDVEKALRILKKKMSVEGVYREFKKRRHFTPPSLMKKLKKEEAEKRRRKAMKRRPR